MTNDRPKRPMVFVHNVEINVDAKPLRLVREADYEALEARMDDLTEELKVTDAHLNATYTALGVSRFLSRPLAMYASDLKAQADALNEALKKYAHHENCDGVDGIEPCDCGLNQILSAYRQTKGKP